MSVHVYAPRATNKRIVTDTCPDCKQRTRFLEVFTPWYGWDSTCIKCGRQWQDSEWMALDFIRQARQRSIELAKQKFRRTKINLDDPWGLSA